MPSKTYLDSHGLTTYDTLIKNHIDSIIENEVAPAIDAKADDSVFRASGSTHSKGLVPDPGATAGSTKFLREDGTWNVPSIDPTSMPTATGTVTLSGASQANWTQSDSSADDYIKNKPTLSTVATSGSYNDLSNKPSLATVATSGSYSDLSNKPTIPSIATAIADNDSGYATGDQVYDYAEAKSNKVTSISSSSTNTEYPSALAVKTYVDSSSGGFNPSSMPTVSVTPSLNQTQADWNQTNTSAVDYIKNKPTIPVPAQAMASGDTGYVTGDMLYDVMSDIETFLANY